MSYIGATLWVFLLLHFRHVFATVLMLFKIMEGRAMQRGGGEVGEHLWMPFGQRASGRRAARTGSTTRDNRQGNVLGNAVGKYQYQ